MAVAIYAILVICQLKQMPFLKHPDNSILHMVHIDHRFNDEEQNQPSIRTNTERMLFK